jgi:hypothetical protein
MPSSNHPCPLDFSVCHRCSLYFFENVQKIKKCPLWIGWFYSIPHFSLRWIYTCGVKIITCWFPAVYLVTMITFNHYCIHRSIVVRNDVHYFTFEGLNVNVRGKEHWVELTKKWTKTTDSSRLDTIFLPDKSVTHDSFVYMRNALTYLQIVNV